MFECLFDSDSAKQFITPLNDIIKVGISEKVILNLTDDSIKISSSTSNKSNFVILKYKKDFLSKCNLPSVPFNFGIKDLSEVVGIMRAFSYGFKMTIENDIMTLKSGKSSFTYYGCNEKHCIKGPKKVNSDTGFYTAFKWDESLKEFTYAINQLREQEHIVISGNKGDYFANLIVTNNQFKRYNNFACKIECTEVKDAFRKIIDKNIFYPVVTSSIDDFVVKVFDEAVMFFGQTDEFAILHAVSTKVK